MNNELIKQIVSNHKELATIRKSYFYDDIEITVNQDKEQIVMWAFNHKSQRFVNLLAKKYSKLIDRFKDITLDMKHKEHYVYFTLDIDNDNKGVRLSNGVYGYARVSTKSQEDNTSLQNQIKILEDSGCTEIYSEVCSGATMDRPIFKELENKLQPGDTLTINRLCRFSRSTENGINKIKELAEKGIKVNILNMGIVDLNNPVGKMMFTILSSFVEYEKDCIVERMKEGKNIAKQNPNFREGRPLTHKESKKAHALELLRGGKTYKEVEQLTGISKSTLIRYKNKIELSKINNIEHLKAKIKLRENLIKLQNISESSIIYIEYLEMIEEVKRFEKSK